VRERLGIPGMDLATARNFRDKARMKDILRANGLPCARHHLATGAGEALSFAEQSGFPLVVKPPAGAGAKNTFRVDSREQLEGYLKTSPPDPRQPLLLEEFVVGREFSFDSVSLRGEHVFHSITEYYPTPLEVMQTPWIQWCVMLPRHIDGPEFGPIRDVGPRVLQALGMTTGMTHMEWFRRADGSVAVSEVAARPPGAQFTTLHSYAHDVDFYAAWARAVVHGEFDVPERKYSAGAVFLRGQGRGGKVVDLVGVEQAQRELGSIVVEAKLPRRGQPQASSYEGEGYVIVRHPETEVVRDALGKLLQTLRVQLG
jgi:biotin carboxylase